MRLTIRFLGAELIHLDTDKPDQPPPDPPRYDSASTTASHIENAGPPRYFGFSTEPQWEPGEGNQ